jgi:predicted aldo/keto reductase-like oxidoreductase
MYSDFTMMAHGTNRPDHTQRFRQRFMHKLKYYPDRYEGVFGCVGCGRCLQKCPISMNIVKVMKKLGGEA